MSNIIQISDFKGYYYVVNNCFEEAHLQSYIDKYEDYYLTLLLGIDLKDLLIANLVNGVPTDAGYLSWFNPFIIEEDTLCNNEKITSFGLKEVLLGLVYYHIVNNAQYMQSLTGLVVNDNENSKMLSFTNVKIVADDRRNSSIPSYNAIAYKLYKDDVYKYSDKLEISIIF